MLQPIMHHFEATCKHLAFFRYCPVYIKERFLHRATNPPSNSTLDNYEAYETYGDSILKLLASLFIFYYGEFYKSRITEKDMSDFIASRVNNEILSRIAEKDVRYIIKPHPSHAQHWEPPYYIKAKKPPNLSHISSGTVADVTEAIIAATYLTHLDLESCCCLVSNLKIVPDIRDICPVKYTLEKGDFLIGYDIHSIKQFHDIIDQGWSYIKLFEEAGKVMKRKFNKGCQVSSAISSIFIQIEDNYTSLEYDSLSLENFQKRILNYNFRNQETIKRALTTPGDAANFESSYERLQKLGDAILDCLVMCTTAQISNLQTAQAAQNVKSRTVRNNTLGKLCLMIGLPLYTKSGISIKEYPVLQDFFPNTDTKISKKLADFLQALIGAVFVDSRSLTITAQVFAPLFLPLILYHLKFKEKIEPKTPEKQKSPIVGASSEQKCRIPLSELLD